MTRTKVQHLLFPSTRFCTERNMYFRLSDDAEFNYSRDVINFKKAGSTAFFNTYFNSFSAGKWKQYTETEYAEITLRLKGGFCVTLWRADYAINDNRYEKLGEEICSCEDESEFTFRFNDVQTAGVLYFTLKARQPGSEFLGGYYSVVSTAQPRHVKLGISICHFKKEAYIRTNASAVNEYLKSYPELCGELEMFISDNGGTLAAEDAPYPFVHIFTNKNVGGAGGFTRCMMEIQRANRSGGDITHALLMDDDLTFDPEIFFRTRAFLSLLKEKFRNYYFSGLMNRTDNRNIQHENGALWNGGNFISLKPNFDMNKFNKVLFNDCVYESVEFAPWWYCAIPVELTENNLPLPIFYREDDTEYGMRLAEGVISMNGICVWHEPFENKFVPFVCYYHSRNAHIVNALHHPEYGKKHFLRYTLDHIRGELYFMRYKIADLYLQAAEDFLKGIDWLKNTDTVELHKQVAAAGYAMRDIDDIKEMPFIYGEYTRYYNRGPLNGWKAKVWHHSMCGHLIPALRDVWVPIAPGKVRSEMFIKAKRAYHFDQSTRRGFVTVRSMKEYRRIMKRFRQLKKLAARNYERVAEEYRKRITEVTNTAFWENYLGI